jgi:hypothetical protein
MFASQEVAFSLFEIFTTTRRESLRVTAASAFSRMCRHAPTYLFQLIEKTDPRVIIEHLNDGNSKIQQPFLNLLNLLLYEAPTRIQRMVIDDKQLIPT